MSKGAKSSISFSAGPMSRCEGHAGWCVSGDLVRTGLEYPPLRSACCCLTAVWVTRSTRLRCIGQTYCTRQIVARCHLRPSNSNAGVQRRNIGTPENAVQRLAPDAAALQAVSRRPLCSASYCDARAMSTDAPERQHPHAVARATQYAPWRP